MKVMIPSQFVAVVLAFLTMLASPARGESAVAAIFECQERLGLDWPRTLVNYRVEFKPGQAQTNQLRLVDSNGVEQPFQLSHIERDAKGEVLAAWVSFYASLPATQRSNLVLKTSRYHYELRAEKPLVSVNATLRAGPEAESLVLANDQVAVRLPKTGEVKFDKPLTAAPGPIQGVRLVDGRWTGGSYFFAADTNQQPRVTGYTCEITAQGPLFVEARVRYAFAGGEKYELTTRVLADDPAVRIDEQYDFGAGGNLWKYRLMVSLGKGWQPNVAFGASAENRVTGTAAAYTAKLAEIGITTNVGCSFALQFEQPFTKVFDVAVRAPWVPSVHAFGLVNTAPITPAAAQQKQVPFLGVAPLHPGNWRGAIGGVDAMLFSMRDGDVLLNWPLVVPPHPRDLLHTGEYDPALPLSLGRRQWALIGGTLQTADQLVALRAYEGFVNLDDYKDWLLDWPADPQVTYPRLVFSKADVQRWRPTLDKLPGAEQLRTFLYFNDTATRSQELWSNVMHPNEWNGPAGMLRSILRPPTGGMPWLTHYRYAQMAGWAGNVDELLASEKLSPEQRARLRADLAGLCSLLAEPDVNPRGAMTHLGNPNMPINRFCALPWAAALIPDHPQAPAWLDLAAQYVRYKLAMNTAPGGAWSESMTYFDASAPHLMQTAAVLAQAGRLDETTARLVLLPAQFPLRLITPRDPRFGARIVPGWGHEGVDNMFHFLVAAVVARNIDPALATALVWSWDQTGRPMAGHHEAAFSPRLQVYAELLNNLPARRGSPDPAVGTDRKVSAKESGDLRSALRAGSGDPRTAAGGYVPPQLASAWLPGFGATMRAHAGDPNETYLSLRNGYFCSHSNANQGDFVLYSKGAPLVTLGLMGYCLNEGTPFGTLYRQFGWHARPRFGNQQNDGGWPGGGTRGGVPAHAFGDSVDYARATGDYGPQIWTRQIAFLKGQSAAGPNYFVFRDSFDPVNGDAKSLEQKWWYLRTPGAKGQVQASANGLHHTSAFGGVKLNAHFLQPATITAESRDATHQGPLYFGNAEQWCRAGSPVVKTNSNSAQIEETMTVTAVGPLPPGQDVLVVLSPQGKAEAPSKCESLGDGAAKITTSEGVDYVFLNRQPMKFSGGDVTFEGLAGAVRVYPNEVRLIISEGPGSITYKGATLRSAEPAVQLVRPGTKQVFDLPARQSKLKHTALPAGCRISGDGVCELTIANDRITGQSESTGAFLFVPMPAGMKVLPMLVIDGQTYAPGTTGDGLIIPLMPGEHSFEVRALEQPPIFRNWQAW